LGGVADTNQRRGDHFKAGDLLMNAALMTERVRKDSPHKADVQATPLAPDLIRRMDAYWRSANYLAVGHIYLYDNPLLREPL
jgi:hypothetical protein